MCVAVLVMTTSLYADEPIKIVWDASTGTIETYKVYYNNHSKLTTETFMLLADMNLSRGVKYNIEVTALNSSGESGRSNMVTYTPPSTVFAENPATTINIPGIPDTLILNFNTD